MIKKDKARQLIKNEQIDASRRSNKKINEWVSNILNQAVASSVEKHSSMEAHPSMDTPPWKGTHGDA